MDDYLERIEKRRYCAKVFDYKDKCELVDFYYNLFLNKTNSMFEWKNLPDTFTQEDLELLLQTNGSAIFIKNNDKYFCVYGSLGGLRNQNYRPTIAIVHHPYIPQVDGTYEIYYSDNNIDHTKNNVNVIGKCVVITNDVLYRGIESIINNYANRLADTYISRRMVTIMSRYINVFVARDNNSFINILEFLKKVEKGELAAILDEDKAKIFEEGNVKTLPLASNSGNSRMLTELIECEQYDKASFYNELGLQANYNMKRESINSDESQLNQDAILPFVDTMLKCRQLACKRINELFGLNISVDFSSAWKYKRDEIEIAIDNMENQNKIQDIEQSDEQDEVNVNETNQLVQNENKEVN